MIVFEKINDTFDIDFKYLKIIQATPHVQPSTVRALYRAALNRASTPNLYSTLPPPCVHC